MQNYQSAFRGNRMNRLDVVADIYEGDAGDWLVWSIDPEGDGGMLEVIFSGPDAPERAIEYAEMKYCGFRVRATQQRPHLCYQNQHKEVGCRPPTRDATLRLVK